MEHGVALQRVVRMCVGGGGYEGNERFFILMLAMIPTIVYLIWSMKNLYNTIRVNQKGGEIK
jgi:hypothetical protein